LCVVIVFAVFFWIVAAEMKNVIVVLALCALFALIMADDPPECLFPCSFRMTSHMSITTKDGEELATSINELARDNGDYWVWKSKFSGDEFIRSIVPDHEWSIIWRPDNGTSFRHDINLRTCFASHDLPTPYKWVESKTYGIVWFDEPAQYDGQDATLYSAVTLGNYSGYEFEAEAHFYVLNEDGTLVHVNGTVSANHGEIDLDFRTISISFEHNKPVDPRSFVVSAPCELHGVPESPSATFKEKCYHTSGSSVVSVSWLLLVVAILVTLLSF